MRHWKFRPEDNPAVSVVVLFRLLPPPMIYPAPFLLEKKGPHLRVRAPFIYPWPDGWTGPKEVMYCIHNLLCIGYMTGVSLIRRLGCPNLI